MFERIKEQIEIWTTYKYITLMLVNVIIIAWKSKKIYNKQWYIKTNYIKWM
jgi:hypothetical protein